MARRLIIVFVLCIGMFWMLSASLYAEGQSKRYEILVRTSNPYGTWLYEAGVSSPSFATQANSAAFLRYGRFIAPVVGGRPLAFTPITLDMQCLGDFCDPNSLALSHNGVYSVSGTHHHSEECGTRWCEDVTKRWTLHLYDSSENITTLLANHLTYSYDNPMVSNDGNFVSFVTEDNTLAPNDTNATKDVFFYNRSNDIITIASRTPSGASGNGASTAPSMSADGRFVVFTSLASDLVPNDTNNVEDIFLFDSHTNTVSRLSTAIDGTQSNAASWIGSIEANGRYVVFASNASNLVVDDTNNTADIFLRDLQNGTITRISLTNDGSQANDTSFGAMVSADGTKIVFGSFASNLVEGDTNNRSDIFLRNLTTSTTVRVSVASNGTQGVEDTYDPAISADGKTILFTTSSRLQPSDTNTSHEIYAHDWLRRTYRVSETLPTPSDFADENIRISVNALSPDGTMATYRRIYRDPVIEWVNRHTQQGTSITTPYDGEIPLHTPSASDNNRYLAFIENGTAYRLDATTDTREPVSILPNGTISVAAQVMISGDGNQIVFRERLAGSGTPQLYRRTIATGTTTRITHIPGSEIPSVNGSRLIDITTDGAYVLYTRFGEGSQVDAAMRYDASTNESEMVSLSEDNLVLNGDSIPTSISGDGRYVLFLSEATNVTDDDANGAVQDLFLRDTVANTTTLLATAATGSNANGKTINGVISHNGRYVAVATTLAMVAEDTNATYDIYLLDRESDTVTWISPEQGISPALNTVALQLAISHDGSVILFEAVKYYMYPNVSGDGDTSIFVYDQNAPELTHRAFAPLIGR